MTNKERVYQTLQKLSKDIDFEAKQGYTASEIAEKTNIKRNVASSILNQLYRDGKVVRIKSRPVYFIDKEIYEYASKKIGMSADSKAIEKFLRVSNNPFKKLIGYNGSLKSQVEQVKSAVTYPPSGLPLLLTGDTGVGKSYIAQLMHEYAVVSNVIPKEAPYVIFNCAKYADNPELLAATLFGHVKGSFTGADRDKPGLLEEADSGYLFLDEVHRLSPEGQEKLFLFMDKGIFRRLGEIGKWRKSKVRLIFATTESLERSLLKTFLRRIPIVVDIPKLSERPMTERLS